MTQLLLTGSTLLTGLMAGLFFAFTISVMPALSEVGDSTLIDVMQRINRRIQHAAFAVVFVGALVVPTLAVVSSVANDEGTPVLVGLGLAAYVLALIVTAAGNIPLNNALDRAGVGASVGDPAAVRRAFESRWVRFNAIRLVACVVSTVLYLLALVYGPFSGPVID